jgi:hypothetical protein
MNRKVAFLCLLALGVWIVVGQPASASVFWSKVSFDGKVDEFKDASRANFLDGGTSGVADGRVDAGDIIYGLIRFGQKSLQTGEAFTYSDTQQVVAAYAFQVTNSPVDGGVMTFAAVPHTDPNSLYAFSSASIQGLQSTAAWDKSIVILLDQDGVSNPVDMNAPGPAVIASVIGPAAVGWTTDAIAGLVATGANADFLQGKFDSYSLAVFASTFSPNPLGTERGGFTLQYDNIGKLIINPVFTNDFFGAVTSHDITFGATVEGLRDPGTGLPDPNWAVQDSSNFDFNFEVPEAGSFAVWFLLTSAVGLVGWFRRRQK